LIYVNEKRVDEILADDTIGAMEAAKNARTCGMKWCSLPLSLLV
jgi:hypothetical protein